MSAEYEEPKLQSLAQAARGKQLKTARGILFVIGALTILVNGIQFFMLQAEIDKLRNQGMMIDQERVQFNYLLIGGALAVGILFVIFGFLVKAYPVPITITALVLYIGATIIFGIISPETLAAGAIVKIIIVVAMIKAIQAGIEYNKELDLQASRVGMEL